MHGIVGVTGGAAFGGNGATPAGLNDGNNGGDFGDLGLPALVGAAWPSTTSTIEYDLGIGTGDGFDITEIQSIAAWQGAGLNNQNYNVLVKYLGDPGFTALTTVTYQPFNSGGGSTKVNVTDGTGVLASGIEAIRFEFLATDGNAAGSVYREIDVIGVETISGPDLTDPTVNTLSPADEVDNVPAGNNLVVTFNENIAIGTGNITIKNLDTSSQTAIPVGDAQISVSGAVMTINPVTDLDPNANYAIQIDATAIDDIAGNSFIGISNDTIWNFNTLAVGVVKVFLLGGQSNSVGQAPTSGLPTSPVDLQQPQNDVQFYYDGSQLTTLRPGSGGNPPPSGLHFGPEVTFGREVADASPSVAYAIIKHGENGTALYNDWAPGTGASYTAFRNTVDAGLAALQTAGYTTEIVGMLWHQGESDAIESEQDNYASNLTAFIADVRTRYGANLPFLIGEIRRSNGAKFVTVADAQIAVAAADENAKFVPASDLTFSDTYHFDAPGMTTLGERFATAYTDLTADLTAPNTFGNWVADLTFGLDPEDRDFADDSDGDSLVNGLEAWFGTHPGEHDQAFSGFATDGLSTTFSHPQNENIPWDLSGYYEWSPNLTDWYPNDSGPDGGATVDIQPNTIGATTTVTATASQRLNKLFLRVGVTQN